LKILASASFVTSVRGASGGYRLVELAQSISLADIVTATEGPIALTACVESVGEGCSLEHVCSIKGRWDPVNDAIYSALDSVKLSDMVTPPINFITHKKENQLRVS
jgi:Rrf2 family protein